MSWLIWAWSSVGSRNVTGKKGTLRGVLFFMSGERGEGGGRGNYTLVTLEGDPLALTRKVMKHGGSPFHPGGSG